MDRAEQAVHELFSAINPFVPRWHAICRGHGELRAEVEIDLIVVETRDEALRYVVGHLSEVCAQHGVPFSPHDWRVERLWIDGGN